MLILFKMLLCFIKTNVTRYFNANPTPSNGDYLALLEPRERDVIDLDRLCRFDPKFPVDLSPVILPMQEDLRQDVPDGRSERNSALVRIVDHLVQLGFLEPFDIDAILLGVFFEYRPDRRQVFRFLPQRILRAAHALQSGQPDSFRDRDVPNQLQKVLILRLTLFERVQDASVRPVQVVHHALDRLHFGFPHFV